MRKFMIGNKPRCATCDQRIHHEGEKTELKAASLEKMANTAPNPDSPTYVKARKEAEQLRRTGGWTHSLWTDVSHDPAPHDDRTVEEELDRTKRALAAEPENIKAIRAMLSGKSHPAASAAQNKDVKE